MAYRAEIQIGVVGIGQLGTLQKSLNQVATTVDLINKKRVDAGFNVQNINTYNAQLEKAWQNINKAAMGSKEELKAVQDLVRAKNNQIAAQERLNRLIAKEETAQRRISATANAGFGVQGPKLPASKGGGMPPKKGLQAPGVMDAILGAGFPMLFGGGPGAVLGGGAGGLIGGAMGGMAGMALSVGLSAVGQQLDASVVKVKAMGDAINAIDTSALRESFIVVNSELDTTVRRLIEAGEIDKARAVLAAEVAAQTGASTQAISGITNKTQDLFTAWDRFTSAVSTTAGIVATPLLDGITGVLNIISLAAQGANTLLSLFAQAGPILERSLTPLLPFVGIFRFLAKKVSEAMPKGVNEEVQKRNAALEEETDNRMYNLVLMGKQEQIDKRRNRGNTAAAQIQNNELDRQEKINELIAKRDQDLRAARKEFAGTDNQQLAVLEKQIQVEFKLNQRLVEREALRKRERLELQQTLDVISATSAAELGAIDRKEQIRKQDLTLSQAILESGQKFNTLEQNIANSRLKGYQTQLQFSTSLNETYAIYGAMSEKVNEIAATQQEAARQEAQMTKLRADASVREAIADAERASVMARAAEADREALRSAGELTALKEVELNNIIAQEAIAERNIGITRETAKLAKEDADAQLVTAKILIERNRLEEQRAITVQKVAAYAADAARQTEAFTRAANEGLNAMNNNLNVVQAFSQAQQTINNLELQSLQTKLDQATTDEGRYDILYRIRDLEIENAKITLYATRAQIKAEIERQRIALAIAEVKYRELQAVVNLARAQKVLNQGHLDALAAQKSALVIAQQNYETSIQVANEQWRAADAVYEAAVQAAEFKASMEGTAAAAERTAAATAEAAAASKADKAAISGSFTTVGKAITPVGMGLFKSEEARRARLSFTPTKFGGFDTSQEDRQAAMTSFRERIMGSTDSQTVNPQVNITTGPVMQMDGTNYVTQRDLMAATGSAARQGAKMALDTLRNNPSSRRSTGVTR